MLNSPRTQALIEAAQDGDVEALNELLHRCQPDMQRFARRVCVTPEDVEDAVQEALWIVSKKIGTLRVISAYTSWLFRIVKHHCLRLLHINQRETTVTVPLDTIESDNLCVRPDTQDTPADEIVAAVAALAPIYRQVLIMRDVEDMTAPEVAAELGITVQAVKSRLHRARLQVRQALQAAQCITAP